METFSTLLALCAGNSLVTGEFPSQRPVTRSFDAFLDLRLNKRLSKQLWRWWFETPSPSLWRHCNGFMWLLFHVLHGCFYDHDVIKWKRFPHHWPFVRGNHRSPVDFLHKRPVTQALMFPLMLVSTNGQINRRVAGDLRRQHAHCDVTAMVILKYRWHCLAPCHNKAQHSTNCAHKLPRAYLTWSSFF